MSDSRVALVVGATRGIGREIALSLAKAGYDVCITGRSEATKPAQDTVLPGTLRETLASLARVRGDGRYWSIGMDVLDLERCVEQVKDFMKSINATIDVLVVNAVYQGPGAHCRVDALDHKELDRMVRGNFATPVALVNAVLPGMRAKKKGAIFQLISSSTSTKPIRAIDKGGFQALGYTSTKSAVAKMVPLLALEHADLPGLRFFNLDPGLVVTETMLRDGTAEKYKKWGDNPPEWSGKVVAHLVTAGDDDPIVKAGHGADSVSVPKLASKI